MKLFIFIIALFSTNVLCNAQNRLDELVNLANQNLSNYPLERVYIQTSKPTYETGKDLWFKSYILNDQVIVHKNESKTLFLQMVNFADSVVWKEKYLVDNKIAKALRALQISALFFYAI